MKVGLFIPCYIDAFFPEVGVATLKLLERLGSAAGIEPHIGYEKAAQISLKAYREDLTLRQAALELGFVTAEQIDEGVGPEDMTHPLAPRSGQCIQMP